MDNFKKFLVSEIFDDTKEAEKMKLHKVKVNKMKGAPTLVSKLKKISDLTKKNPSWDGSPFSEEESSKADDSER